MRKFTFSLLTVFNTMSAVNAQIKKGSNLIGGSIYYNSQKSDQTSGNSTQGTKNSGFGITPSYGKAIRDNLVIGATLNYGNSVNENYSPGNNTTTKNNSFGAGVFIRPYKNLGNSGFYLFLDGHLGANYSKAKFTAYENKGFDVSAGINPGISFAITPKVHIETGLNNLFYAGYSSNKSTNMQPVYSTKSSGFNAGIGLGSSTTWTVGVKFIFGS